MLIPSDQLSILAVDKDVHMVRLLERIVKEKTVYEILTTANSLEVPALLDERHFDLIISDLKMPGFNGIDLLKTVRERKSKERIVIITASGNFQSVIECMSLGAHNYITKPFSKEQIISVVESAMQIQVDKQKSEIFSNLVVGLPYTEASKLFEREYILQLNFQFDGDIQKMTESSGLSKRQLRRSINEISNTKNNIDIVGGKN